MRSTQKAWKLSLLTTGIALWYGFAAGACAGATTWVLFVAIFRASPALLLWAPIAALCGAVVGVFLGGTDAIVLGIYVAAVHRRQPVAKTATGITVLSVAVTFLATVFFGSRAGGSGYVGPFIVVCIPISWLCGSRVARVYRDHAEPRAVCFED